jgi:hypothetical protein
VWRRLGVGASQVHADMRTLYVSIMPTPEDLALAGTHFHQDMLDGCQTLKKLGYWPGYFHREVANIGGVQTVHNLLAKSDTSDGFSTLWGLDRLDLAVEAFVLLPWYACLFSDEERATARRRLENVRFDVDIFQREAKAPLWAARLSITPS